MLLMLRPNGERGVTKTPWLTSYHSFSFNQFYDPEFMGIGSLRVLNEDHVEPGGGFETHSHRDAEIISYVTNGQMLHEDSEGNRYTLSAGEFQVMTAGRGITHSEFNASTTEPMSFIQIWLWPEMRNLEPSWQQQKFQLKSGLQLIAAPIRSSTKGVLPVHQDVYLHRLNLLKDERFELQPNEQRFFYIHLISGALRVNQHEMSKGDGLALSENIFLEGLQNTEALVFDLHQCAGRRP